MAVKIPECNSCCLCFPILSGLHVWCCLKIAAYVFVIPLVGYFLLLAYLMRCFGIGEDIYLIWVLYSVMTLILFILLITDFIVTIVFACRGHEENVELIRRYYEYNIGVLVVLTQLILAALAISIAKWGRCDAGNYLFNFTIVVLQAYFILLLSQFIQLESSNECRPIRV